MKSHNQQKDSLILDNGFDSDIPLFGSSRDKKRDLLDPQTISKRVNEKIRQMDVMETKDIPTWKTSKSMKSPQKSVTNEKNKILSNLNAKNPAVVAPSSPVKSNTFKRNKQNVPDSAVNKPPGNVKPTTPGQPSSRMRQAQNSRSTKDQPIFIRTSSVRPKSLDFFDQKPSKPAHEPKIATETQSEPEKLPLSHQAVGTGVLNTDAMIQTDPIMVEQSTSFSGLKISAETMGSNSFVTARADEDKTHVNASVQYESGSSVPKSHDNEVRSRKPSVSATPATQTFKETQIQTENVKPIILDSVIKVKETVAEYRPLPRPISLEQRIAEWIQSEVVLKLLQEPKKPTNDEIASPVVQETQRSKSNLLRMRLLFIKKRKSKLQILSQF